MNRFTILILFCSSISFAQETKLRLRPGIQVASVFSDNYDHGVSPALTLNYGRCMLTLGPRFTYERMINGKPTYQKRSDQVIIDAAFRYYLLPETKRVRPFVQAALTYKYTHVVYEQDYRDGMMLPYGQIYDYDFLGKWDHKGNSVRSYIGFGVDVTIWKQLSVFASAGAGTSVYKGKSELKNVETGAVEDFYRSQNNGQFSWIASVGLGYRF